LAKARHHPGFRLPPIIPMVLRQGREPRSVVGPAVCLLAVPILGIGGLFAWMLIALQGAVGIGALARFSSEGGVEPGKIGVGEGGEFVFLHDCGLMGEVAEKTRFLQWIVHCLRASCSVL